MESTQVDRQWTALVADAALAEAARKVAPHFPEFELVLRPDGEYPPRQVSERCQALVTQSATVDRTQLESMPGLRVVLKMGCNYCNVDADAVRQRGLVFACAPRKGPNCVAELALTLILSLSKDLLVSHRSVAQGAYRLRGLKPEPSAQWKMAFHWMQNERVHEIRNKVLGIVGMGEIGCELARRANVMGMRVIYTRRTPLSPELERRFAAEFRVLDALLAESDFVCLAVPHTAETARMIGSDQLARMRSTAYLVNICRGGVVDEAALIQALQTRQLAGAGLDVFTLEPLQADSPLCSLDNVILTPHIGGGTGSNYQLELGEALRELGHILAGGRPHVDVSSSPHP